MNSKRELALPRVLVLIPTFNEALNIEALIHRFAKVRVNVDKSFNLDLLVIDDASPDLTSQIVKSLNLSWVKVLDRKEKNGLGPAYIAGFRYGLAADYKYLVECDADGSHQPEELPLMLDAVGNTGANLILGTRWMPGGKVVNWPWQRRLISRVGTFYAGWALQLPYRDLTGGYRVFDRQVLERLDLNAIATKGYGFQVEMALRTHDAGFVIAEVPITFIERVHGVSKMSRKIVFEALVQVTRWGFKRRFRFQTNK